jgi:hypothetical protein
VLFQILFLNNFLVTNNYNESWNVLSIKATFDIFGAIIPTIISLILLTILLYHTRVPLKIYLLLLTVTVVSTCIFSNFPTLISNVPESINNSLTIDYGIIAFVTSLAAVFLTNQMRNYTKLGNLTVTVKDKTPFLLAASSSAIGVLLVDLFFVLLVNLFSIDAIVNVGGNGLMDGILLTPLITPFFVLFFTLILVLLNPLLAFHLASD